MNSKTMARHLRCGACAGRLDEPWFVILNRLARWEHPTAGNVLTGESGRAVGVLCDGCVRRSESPREAIEFTGVVDCERLTADQVVYHPVEQLDESPPEVTAVIHPATVSSPASIECLRCGQRSYHPEDVRRRWCGQCNQFHEGV